MAIEWQTEILEYILLFISKGSLLPMIACKHLDVRGASWKSVFYTSYWLSEQAIFEN